MMDGCACCATALPAKSVNTAPQTAATLLGELNNLFAKIVTFKHADERRRRVINTVSYCFPVFQFAFVQPATRQRIPFRCVLLVVGYDKALHLDVTPNECRHASGARRHVFRLVVVVGDHAAQGDTTEQCHVPDRGFQDFTTNIFEVDIDAFREGSTDGRMNTVDRLVVKRLIETEPIFQPCDFFVRASTTNNSTTGVARNLPDHGTDRACRCRN